MWRITAHTVFSGGDDWQRSPFTVWTCSLLWSKDFAVKNTHTQLDQKVWYQYYRACYFPRAQQSANCHIKMDLCYLIGRQVRQETPACPAAPSASHLQPCPIIKQLLCKGYGPTSAINPDCYLITLSKRGGVVLCCVCAFFQPLFWSQQVTQTFSFTSSLGNNTSGWF